MANIETKTETLRRRRDFTAAVISTAASRVAVRVIRTDEDLMIAKTVCGVLGLGMAGDNNAKKGAS
jgi:acetate kinase